MIKKQEEIKSVHYITYEYDDLEEKERHILEMGANEFECLDNFEDATHVTFRKFLTE